MLNLLDRFSREDPECLGKFNIVRKLEFEKCFICVSKSMCREEGDKKERLEYLLEQVTKPI
jgi:hypothetical protein